MGTPDEAGKILLRTLLITIVIVVSLLLSYYQLTIVNGNYNYNYTHRYINIKYNSNDLCNAIYWAEGGENAKVPYGILSVHCSSRAKCRACCLRTIETQWRNFTKTNQKSTAFLQFFAGKYCPIGADNDPEGLNRHWLKNVQYYLRNPKEVPYAKSS